MNELLSEVQAMSLEPDTSLLSDYNNENQLDDENRDLLHPILVHSLCGEEINSIAVGRAHCIAKTRGGDVFSWGNNDHDQLGREIIHNLTAQSLTVRAQENSRNDFLIKRVEIQNTAWNGYNRTVDLEQYHPINPRCCSSCRCSFSYDGTD